mgnify:CR=1 FL=1
MYIRSGSLHDLQEIYKLEERIFKSEAWNRKMLKRELLTNTNSKTLIIEDNGIILTYLIFRKYLMEYQILNLGVSPSKQNKGLGHRILENFLENIETNSSVFLEVKKGNFRAINLYKKNGFKVFGERKKYYKDGSSALIMNYYKII